MKILFSLLTALSVLFAQVPVQTKTGIELSWLNIDIWPEYDRPDVLVMYRFELADHVPLPKRISLHIPEAAGEPYNLAMEDVDGMLYNLEYSLIRKGEWIEVSFTTPSPIIQLEYYDPQILRNGNDRKYTFVWPGDYQVESMMVRIQEPINTRSMTIEPALGEGRLEPDGLTYFQGHFGLVESGLSFSVFLNYEKLNNDLSANLQEVEPVEEISNETQGRNSLSTLLVWGMGFLGVLLVIAGFVYWSTHRRMDTLQTVRTRKLPKAEKEEHTVSIYCSQCGRRAKPGDVFCRSCGSKLRVD